MARLWTYRKREREYFFSRLLVYLGSSGLKFLLRFRSSCMRFFIGSLSALGKISVNVKFGVLTVVNTKMTVLWDVTFYSLVHR
jgi:hypothetical protein